MHVVSVIHILSLLLLFQAGAMLIPIPFSFFYGESDYQGLLYSAGITAIVGGVGYRLTRFKNDLRAKEGFAVVTFGWLAASFFGALPFMLSGAIPSLTDAFFETISGFTTTGATILTDIEALPKGILFWRSMTQWLGGMGIIVLSLAILPFLGVGGMQLFRAEVPGPVADKLTPRVTQTAKILWGVYALMTLAQAALLMLGGMNLYDALTHSFTTLSTGGYSTRNASVGAYQSPYIDYVITVFMILAGANFTLHYRFLRGDWRIYRRDREFVVYLVLIVVVTLLIGLGIWRSLGVGLEEAWRAALFQVVSIMTTTGFGTADYEQWGSSSQYLLLVLMLVGACAGSTAGGIKVMRVYLLLKFSFSEITRLIHPHAVVPVRMKGMVVQRDVVLNILGFFVLFMLVYAVGVLVLTMLGLDLVSALGATAATLGNIGPGLGSVGPTDNYSHIPGLGKWILSLLMLLGRLEVFTVVILFAPSYWKK